VANWGRL